MGIFSKDENYCDTEEIIKLREENYKLRKTIKQKEIEKKQEAKKVMFKNAENEVLKKQIQKLLKKEKQKMKILSLYDKLAETYGKPFVSPNLAVATRDFSQACQEEESVMAKYPNDIELCYIGDFDEITGQIIPCKNIATIASAKEYVNGKRNNSTNNNDNNKSTN